MFQVISMFSGAGGLDMGFHNQGFRILWANDFFKDACDTYDLWANYYEDGTRKPQEECTTVVCGDISKLDLEKAVPQNDIDVVLGGFPCQGFSLAGPRQVDDSRNVLYRHFVEMVRLKNPRVIVAENVIGIKTLGGGVVFQKIVDDFSELGYTMSAPVINAKNFGVPQDRMRVIFIGIRNDICNHGAYIFPQGDPKVIPMGEVLKNLPPVDMEDVCRAPFSSRFMSRNRKRDFSEVSFTIPAMAKQVPLSPDSGGMRHVDVDKFEFVGENRRLSYKEAAAIQTFPVDMRFCGDLESKYKQIGNAVPVKLAETIAAEVKKILTLKDLTPYLNFERPEAEVGVDRRITSTVINGKAFEYAVLTELYNALRRNGWEKEQLEYQEDKNLDNIQRAYQMAESEDEEYAAEEETEGAYAEKGQCNAFRRAAWAAARYLLMAEPVLQCPKNLFGVLAAMPDSAGIKGDVRDICVRIYQDKTMTKKVGEIGISCKNNHEAVKHPRITEDPDFAKEWTKGKFACSKTFMDEMEKLQDLIDVYAQRHKTWAEVDEKMDTVYHPVVKLFAEEIRRLGTAPADASAKQRESAGEFTRLFFEYMFGTQDFYKVIKEDASKSTKIYPYNMHGSLMKSFRDKKSMQSAQCIAMPQEIVDVRVKPQSKTTMEIFFDQWIISMRLHNADSRIRKTSLKFDVQIKAQPKKIMGTMLPWEIGE